MIDRRLPQYIQRTSSIYQRPKGEFFYRRRHRPEAFYGHACVAYSDRKAVRKSLMIIRAAPSDLLMRSKNLSLSLSLSVCSISFGIVSYITALIGGISDE